jgi:hypothetical protein
MTRDKAHSYDISILEKLTQVDKSKIRLTATELSDHSIKVIVYITDEKLKETLRSLVPVDPILPPVKDIK